ncbi:MULTISPECIES: hypothetical protein [Paracoccus]|uniref:hypothetical protein n=1 Tax=Paracoccus TaxID=265 RepID=UPI00086F8991|nr:MULTISPECIES: hypothetical protein [Paracoccus]ODT60685.1 MAG: hypothetical protein ABS73_04330 [Paracoccus sp. SCN 68-21]
MSRTRIVRWLRVLLPLLALAMLSTMFLFSRESDVESRIPYAEVDAQAAARENRIVAPEYSGVTGDGAQLTLRAAQAAPGAAGGVAGDLALDWQRPDGLRADLTAPQGGLTDGTVRLEGGVRMTTSSGWQLDAPRIDAQTGSAVIEAQEGVAAEAPFGRITAGRMRLAPGPDGDGAAILNFSDGVRLIYQP